MSHFDADSSTPQNQPAPLLVRKVLSTLDPDVDILDELGQFRQWQESQHQPAHPSPRSVPSPMTRPKPDPRQSPPKQPVASHQTMVEDLELEPEEEDGGLNLWPVFALMCLAIAAGGIGMAFSLLISPEPPVRPQVAEADLETTRQISPLNINLGELELIPVAPSERAQVADRRPSTTRPRSTNIEPLVPRDFDEQNVPPLTAAIEPLSPELTPASELTQNSPPVESGPVASTAPNTGTSGTNRGEGTYLVLMNYQGDTSLARARQIASGAFVKQLGGETYVQLASFQQIEYARHMADELRQQGVTSLVIPQ